MKNLLIVTGPQGSGNHLWSKIFAATEGVYGWSALKDAYWVPHDQEPFAEAWHNPLLLKDIDFGNYAVTSISCPYARHGVTVEPDYDAFINAARGLGYDVKIAVIGRDRNILQYQQERVRGAYSYPRFENKLSSFRHRSPVFLSTELLYLYRMDYIYSLRGLLNFPVYITEEQLEAILVEDPNTKYFQAAEPQLLDEYVKQVSGLK